MTKPSGQPLWRSKADSAFLLILAIAAFLLFFHLDHRPFWQDEAETACLARNVLQFGLPIAFDGVNLVSQEDGHEFDADYLWRWSPWLQIYTAAGAFWVGGINTFSGRFLFAVGGFICIILIYVFIKRDFKDPSWALMSMGILAFLVPFLLFARQCRYYSLGALFSLFAVFGLRTDLRGRPAKAVLLLISLGLLFYANYLLFISFVLPALVFAVLLYTEKWPLKHALTLGLALAIFILPGLLFHKFGVQTSMMLRTDFASVILDHLEKYWVDFVQFMIPLPIAIYLLLKLPKILLALKKYPQESRERFVLFCSLIIIANVFLLVPIPQDEFRYLVHLYPLCAIILGWTVCCLWRYNKFCGALLAILLLFTNWLNLVPMSWLNIRNFPIHNDAHMLTYPNLPLKNFIAELCYPYSDINQNLINFFKAQASAGDTILVTYEDLPLQFYTPYRIMGGLEGRIPEAGHEPEWVVKSMHVRWDRQRLLPKSARYIQDQLHLEKDYEEIVLPWEDEVYGNRADPYYHRFVAPVLQTPVVIYRKKCLN